jgi:hypothetical protein
MKNKSILIAASVLLSATSFAQEMNGFRTDNYNGVYGAFFNPANLANSPYKLDIGLLGFSMYAGNKSMGFNFNTLNNIGSNTGILNQLVGNGNTNSLLFQMAINMPSISYRINEKTTLAFVSRTRLLMNINDIDGTLINSINSETQKDNFPYSINTNTNMRMSGNAFSEFGFSLGQEIFNEGNHYVKMGATLKYIGGVSNSYLQINKLKTTIDADSLGNNPYLTNSSGTIAVGVGGVDFNNTNVSFQYQAASLAADLGLIYEYRTQNLSEDRNKYLFKIGLAVLDLGRIKYTLQPANSGAYDIHIAANQRFNLDNFDGNNVKSVLDANPTYFTANSILNNAKYSVALPSTLQLSGDFRATKNVYVAANVQVALTNNESKVYNPIYYNSFTITPRFESKLIAAYLPIYYNSLTKSTNLGIGFRAGPLYAGSASLLSTSFGKSKQVDFYVGLRFGFKRKAKEA